MPTIHGLTNGTIYPQPGFSARQNENAGWTASQDFLVTKATWDISTNRAKFQTGTSIATINPDIPAFYHFLKVSNANPIHEEGQIVRISVEFSGSEFAQYNGSDLGSDAVPRYRLDGHLTEAPFSEHPKWKAMPEPERYYLGKQIAGEAQMNEDATALLYPATTDESVMVEFALTDPSAVEFAKLIHVGETGYMRPSYTWTEYAQGNASLAAAQLNNLGKIDTPRGNPPEPGTGRQWMLTGASQESSGDLKQTALEWTISDDDGYSTFLYS